MNNKISLEIKRLVKLLKKENENMDWEKLYFEMNKFEKTLKSKHEKEFFTKNINASYSDIVCKICIETEKEKLQKEYIEKQKNMFRQGSNIKK